MAIKVDATSLAVGLEDGSIELWERIGKYTKGPFKYYVIMFLTLLGPPTSLIIYSTVNH